MEDQVLTLEEALLGLTDEQAQQGLDLPQTEFWGWFNELDCVHK